MSDTDDLRHIMHNLAAYRRGELEGMDPDDPLPSFQGKASDPFEGLEPEVSHAEFDREAPEEEVEPPKLKGMSRRRSLFEYIVRTAEAGGPIRLHPNDVKRLADLPVIRALADAHEAILDLDPAPMGANPTAWADNIHKEKVEGFADRCPVHRVPTKMCECAYGGESRLP